MLRSKGFFWVAADHRIAYEWAQAGGVNNLDAAETGGPLPHVKNGITLTVNGRTSNRDGIRATAIVTKHWFLSVNTWTKPRCALESTPAQPMMRLCPKIAKIGQCFQTLPELEMVDGVDM